MTHEEWLKEGEKLFGKQARHWRFVCPSCGNVATAAEFLPFKKGDVREACISVTIECIGRYTGARGAFDPAKFKPCNYAGYGLFRINPVRVEMDGHEIHCFAFADSASGN